MTDAQRIARGRRARALLASEDISAALLEIGDDLKTAIVSSAPDRADLREQAYAEYHGLKRLVVKLQAWAGDAAMLEKREAERETRS